MIGIDEARGHAAAGHAVKRGRPVEQPQAVAVAVDMRSDGLCQLFRRRSLFAAFLVPVGQGEDDPAGSEQQQAGSDLQWAGAVDEGQGQQHGACHQRGIVVEIDRARQQHAGKA